MIGQLIHKQDVERLQKIAIQKVHLIESIHQLNSIITYKLEALSLGKPKITYKNKSYKQTCIQLLSKRICCDTSAIILSRAAFNTIKNFPSVTAESFLILEKTNQILGKIVKFLAIVGVIVFVASQIYAGFQWRKLEMQLKEQNDQMDAALAQEVNYFNKIVDDLDIEGQGLSHVTLETIKGMQIELLKML